jgi:hypothetical protein
MGRQQISRLTSGVEQTLQQAFLGAPAANQAELHRPADLTPPDLRSVRGIVSSLAVGAAIWAAIAGVIWLLLR